MAEWNPYTEYTEKAVLALELVYGIYKLSVRLKNRNLKVFYVGSGQVKERLLAHLSPSEEEIRGYTLYYYKIRNTRETNVWRKLNI